MIENVLKYLTQTLGIEAEVETRRIRARLPVYLRDVYDTATIRLMGEPVLLLMDRSPVETPPEAVRKHLASAQTKWQGNVVYVRERIASYNRKRLIEKKIPFIAPGSQLYLPPLGIDLREHSRRLREQPVRLSPATQVLVISLLTKGAGGDTVTPGNMASRLGYSRMTMTRAFDELEAHSLADIVRDGKERILKMSGTRNELWGRSRPLMRNPVRKRLFVAFQGSMMPGIASGLTALARGSMLAEPGIPCRAVSGKAWKEEATAGATVLPYGDSGATEIEIWRYDPAMIAEGGVVDPFSLFLSLEGTREERVQTALEALMKGALS